MPNAIEAHLCCFAENPGADFVVGHIDHLAEDGSSMESPRWPLLQANFYEELLRVNHVAKTNAVMFRRGVIAAVTGARAQNLRDLSERFQTAGFLTVDIAQARKPGKQD